MRGLDGEGNAANYVETEQIVQFEGGTSSFVQVCMPIVFCQLQNVWIGCEDEKRMNILLFLVIFFPQTRGSIPLYWSQRPNLKYKPTPILNQTADHVSTTTLYPPPLSPFLHGGGQQYQNDLVDVHDCFSPGARQNMLLKKVVLSRAYFNPHLAAWAKMSLSCSKNTIYSL